LIGQWSELEIWGKGVSGDVLGRIVRSYLNQQASTKQYNPFNIGSRN